MHGNFGNEQLRKKFVLIYLNWVEMIITNKQKRILHEYKKKRRERAVSFNNLIRILIWLQNKTHTMMTISQFILIGLCCGGVFSHFVCDLMKRKVEAI